MARAALPARMRPWRSSGAGRPARSSLTLIRAPAANTIVFVPAGARMPAGNQITLPANCGKPPICPGSSLVTVPGAGHFMIASHAANVAGLVREHVAKVEALG